MRKLGTLLFIIASLSGMALIPGVAFAAVDLITFHTNPKTPGPHQQVSISIQSYAVDLDSAMLSWYVDKKVVASGIGVKSIQAETKELGETVAVNVVITTGDNGRHDKELLLRPAEIDLLWEADTYTPPFYKGKALPTHKSLVKLTAIPRFNTTTSDPRSYSYTWTANRSQGIGSGLSKYTTAVRMGYAGTPVPITVEVINPEQSGEKGEAAQTIMATDPLLLFYEDAPLLGIRFDHALLGSVLTHGTQFTLRAAPYFFSTEDMGTSNMIYTWQQDGQKVPLGSDPNVLVLSKQGTGEQSSTLQLSVQNKKRILQSDRAVATISFSTEQ
jgi:hypothetical protein